jgi:hypothetical protein
MSVENGLGREESDAKVLHDDSCVDMYQFGGCFDNDHVEILKVQPDCVLCGTEL